MIRKPLTIAAIVFAIVFGVVRQDPEFVHSAAATPPLLAQVDAATDALSDQEDAVSGEDAAAAAAIGDTTDGVAGDGDAESEAEPVDMGRGLAIAFSGMIIVAVSLLLIIGFISSLPRILAVLENYFPEAEDHHARKKSHPESQVAEDEAVLAAIGYVLHSRLNQDA